MRIAFLGKGGAGKTTTSAGFVRYMAKRHPFVLAIDADVNAHMRGALHLENISGEEVELGQMVQEILDYVKGRRVDMGEGPMMATTPPSLLSNFMRINPADPFIQKYAQHSGNIALLAVGTYKESDVGGSCYHTKLAGLAALLHHTLDTEKDIVIADTTAGTDNVATSLNFAYDLNVFVIEPTKKSMNVYLDFIKVAPHLYERTYLIVNKVDSEADKTFVGNHVDADRILGMIPHSKHLKRFEQGKREALADFRQEQEQAFAAVENKLLSTPKDWDGYLKRLKDTHVKVCRDWFDAYYGMKLDEGLDEAFTYQQVLNTVPGKEPALALR